ncbi:MAG: amidase, partial [Chloroflexi bacterium]|nr:amidase [Chloroflexota bacterium]
EVSDLDLPSECDGLGDAWDVIVAAGAASAFAGEYADRRDELSPALRELVEAGRALGAAERSRAEALALHCRAAVSETFAQFDAFLTPSAPGEAPAGIASTGDPLCNRVWTLLRLPCVALPSGTGEGGLPVGVQLVGRHGGDQSLLELASAVAELLPAPAFPGDRA